MARKKPSVQVESRLKKWLEGIGLGHYGELFAQHRIDLDVVPDLSESDLAELGLPMGDRRRFQRAVLSLDVRHPADGMRRASAERLTRAAEEIASRRGLTMTCAPRLDQGAVAMDASIAALLDRALERTGAPAHRMSSGAGHDAMKIAAAMPVGMLFQRCEGGISHNPAENVREDDVVAALEAGVMFLDELASRQRG